MPANSSSSAAAPMAGYLIQICRAIFHLSLSAVGDYVGVETFDDVVKVESDGSETWEQDKLTLSTTGSPLTDRSREFWRTLEIWAEAWVERRLDEKNVYFFLTTNRCLTGKALAMLAFPNRNENDNANILRLLKSQYQELSPKNDKDSLQSLINNVLNKGDSLLLNIIKNIHIQAGAGQLDIDLITRTKALLQFAGLGIDEDLAYESLIGWCQKVLLQQWFSGQEGWLNKEAFNCQVYNIVENMKKKKILPTAARLLPVTEDDKYEVKDYRFVDHLSMIDLNGEWLDEEISHYIRFSKEKFRLTESGNILEEHWSERGDRLKQRWQTIRREKCFDYQGDSNIKIGQRILNDAAKHNESLAGSEMQEKYMTMGHYHRLADSDRIAWHPDFKCKD